MCVILSQVCSGVSAATRNSFTGSRPAGKQVMTITDLAPAFKGSKRTQGVTQKGLYSRVSASRTGWVQSSKRGLGSPGGLWAEGGLGPDIGAHRCPLVASAGMTDCGGGGSEGRCQGPGWARGLPGLSGH